MYSILHSPTASIARLANRAAARALIVAFALPLAAGCSLLSDNLDRAAKGAGKVVKTYCENVTIPEIREEVRAAVNKHAAPHSVAIECVDKSAPVLKSDEPASVAPSPSEADAVLETDPADDESAFLLNYDARVAAPMFAANRAKPNPVIIIERRKKK